MKKLISALLCASLLTAGASAAYSDIRDPEVNMMAEVLSVTGIIDGMGDGTFAPDGYLTREQFAKVAVCLLGEKDRVAESPAATAFTDVEPDNWARGYIAYVAGKGVIAGYPDGTFGGTQILTYAQAAMVLLRCLGYTDEEIGYHWPSDCVDKARVLGLNKGLDLSADDLMTRGYAARIIYNALFTDMNGSEEQLITKTGITVTEDVVLYGANAGDPSLTETSAGSFKSVPGAVGLNNPPGSKGDLYLNRDKEIVLFIGGGVPSMEVVILSCLRSDARSAFEISFSGGEISVPYSGTVYYEGTKTTAQSVADKFTMGSTLAVYLDEEGGYSAGILRNYVMEGPFVITRDFKQIYEYFGISAEPTVIRKGVAAKVGDIDLYDVVYYVGANNTVYAYADSVSGIYEKASPYKAGVTAVTVDGKEYELSSSEAVNKLNESVGAFAIGDYVTLLLDREGKAAAAVDTAGEAREIVVSSCLRNDSRATLDITYSDGTVSVPYSGSMYFEDQRHAALELADEITVGSRLKLYFDREGKYSAGVLTGYKMDGPFTVTTNYGQIYSFFDIEGTPNVIREGASSVLEAIRPYDVVYYVGSTNTVYAYSEKVSGIYEKAEPYKAAVTAVTVGAGRYELASAAAVNKLNESLGAFAIGDYVTLLLDREGKVADVIAGTPGGGNSREIVIISCLKNDARSTYDIGYSGGVISIPYDGAMYYEDRRYTAQDLASRLTAGGSLTVYFDEEGKYSAGILTDRPLDGPYTVTVDYTQLYTLFNLTDRPNVIRDGVSADIQSVSRFDIVYYSPGNNTVYAYTDRVSGIYEKAYPAKAGVTRVTLSGKEYDISTVTAMNKLGESGEAFAFGDYITLLLDRDGRVADAIDPMASNMSDLAVLLEAFSRVNDRGSQEWAVRLFMADGTTAEYGADADYHRIEGELVRCGFRDGKAALQQVKPVSQGGTLNREERTFNGHWLTSDCSILVLAATPKDKPPVIKKLSLGDIGVTELRSYQVLHVEYVGEMEDVALLYLTDIEYEDYDYALILKHIYNIDNDGKKIPTTSYDVLIHGEPSTLDVGHRSFVNPVIGINTLDENDYVEEAVVLGRGEKIEAYTPGRIKVGGTIYRTAEDFDIYRLTGFDEYALVSPGDAMKLDAGQITVYGDKPAADGGLVRVIVIK